MIIKTFRITLIFLLLVSVKTTWPQTADIKNAAELQLAIEKLNVLGSVLYIGAHPDDENTGLLAYLSKEKKYRTAYLSLTRGDGGQNLIGPEKGIEIGIIRTQELLEARKIDGGEQYFTRAIDFGYSKSSDESLNKWGRDSVFADVVWVIRNFRPDVIITRFPADGNGGHGHHTASAILAKEAFYAAGDPLIFPEQLKYVKPWKAKRLFWNTYRPGEDEIEGLLGVDVGKYNPLLGKSYTEIAAQSRTMHKSQGFGSTPVRGPRMEYFKYIAGDRASREIFEGINTGWSRIDNSEETAKMIASIKGSLDPAEPSKSLNELIRLYDKISKLENNYWIPIKKKELLSIIKFAAGLWMESTAADYSAAPGDDIKINTTVVSRVAENFILDKIEFPTLELISSIRSKLVRNQPFTKESILRLPKEYPLSQPYWLAENPSEGLFKVTDQKKIGSAENPPAIPVNISFLYHGETLSFQVPLIYKWNDDVEGELYRPFRVYPPVTANMSERVSVFKSEPKEVQIRLKSISANISGEIHLHTGEGWKITPEVIPFSFSNKYDEQSFSINVTPPEEPGEALLSAEININDKIYTKGSHEINHPHIEQQVYFPESELKLVKADLKMTAARIGYIMGSGDEVAGSLQDIGYDVTMLSDGLLEAYDLSRFDVIIAGIRAYNTRQRLKYVQPKLMDYVRNGGTYIVQYNVSSDLQVENIGPYPFKPGRGRVSVEEAPVKFLKPDHQLLNYPNKITHSDFDGWVQERGLYFAESWVENYDTILSSKDPDEASLNGGMLFSRYGKGVFIYSGYSWFRQLPAGVPGAYKIFVNMISAGQYEKNISN